MSQTFHELLCSGCRHESAIKLCVQGRQKKSRSGLSVKGRMLEDKLTKLGDCQIAEKSWISGADSAELHQTTMKFRPSN